MREKGEKLIEHTLRWLAIVSSNFQHLCTLMDLYYQSLSIDATIIIVFNECPVIDEQVMVIFVVYLVTIVTV